MSDELEQLYVPYNNQKASVVPISKSVVYLGHFVAFGEIWAKHRLWKWKKGQYGPGVPLGSGLFRSQSFQERSLDAALKDLKDCVVLSTTPTYLSQYQNACLLKSRGFGVLEGLCYRHPGYPKLSEYKPEHPGIPDRYWHWEHIWWKVIGNPVELGTPTGLNQLNNCGVDSRCGLEQITLHDNDKDRRGYLTVAWLARGTPFPKGWTRFFSAKDYKLGVNFKLISEHSRVQTCEHNFDMKIFEGWEPDFEKFTPN